MRPVSLRAFAKINLSLHVGEARADGFHQLRTVYQAIDLCDDVICKTARGPFTIHCATPGVPTDDSNLVWKASARLWNAAGRAGPPRDTVITLIKRIPVQGGLGGGSSDAASALVGLRRLWRLRVDDLRLRELAVELESDVPYFLVGGTAMGLGRGDEVYPLEELPRYWAVLALPPFGVATSDAYRWLDDDRQQGTVAVPVVERQRLSLWHHSPANDLEPPVVGRHPRLGQLIRRLERSGAEMAAMSGSGSTVFGVFKTRTAAVAAARSVEGGGVRVLTARFLRRSKV